jgi:hypothetical protein
MNAQLNLILAGQRAAELRHADEQARLTRPLATPATDGIAGQQQQTTFEITR